MAAPLVSAHHTKEQVRLRATLRGQFTLVIFLLAFLPNLVLTFTAQPNVPTLTLVVWMLVVGLLCAVTGYVLSGALLRPLNRLETEVQRGDFAQPHADDPAEIRALRGAFTTLLDRLGTEQGRRSAFMATLVHDLKTPLIATGHLTHALTAYPLPEAERREVGVQIQAETARLLALVQQMADAHRFEREDVQVQLVQTDLRVLLDNVARRMAPQAEARGLSLSVRGSGSAPVDAHVIERAVSNLTENAVRYAQTRVQLSVTPQGIGVEDDGPGLSGDLADLAQPFNAQPALIAGQHYTAGTAGLGLFIVRRIAEAHGGQLLYERHPPPLFDPHRLEPPDPLAPPSVHDPTTSATHTVPDVFSPSSSLFTLTLPEVTP
ncbi:HAMP domain-containing sensor histidine kinase [Deinococcus puniceus]|uniref:histidine kinase n=1 Tax=Deinococcus puniceus TaxID=1182568 RepID=A0A172TD53_9DEIO|nr:HAMP domain-containing sensor histidine kinase [Deinococcus puniceus]ANE44864.1 histidine kinase [Deinococcus puniceus]